MIKGAPHGQQGPAFHHTAQVYAAHGFAALMINYRGSTGYGQKFSDAIFGKMGRNCGEPMDILFGVGAALRRNSWIDRESLGVEGGSCGGQWSGWIITQTSQFKAAIPAYGIYNLVSFNYMSYYHDYMAIESGAFPHQENMMDLLWEWSALKHVANVKTPTMLVHGENDNDVPIAESEQYYTALQDVGVETVFVRYPREGTGSRSRSTSWISSIGASPGTGSTSARAARRARSRPAVRRPVPHVETLSTTGRGRCRCLLGHGSASHAGSRRQHLRRLDLDGEKDRGTRNQSADSARSPHQLLMGASSQANESS